MQWGETAWLFLVVEACAALVEASVWGVAESISESRFSINRKSILFPDAGESLGLLSC